LRSEIANTRITKRASPDATNGVHIIFLSSYKKSTTL